LPDITDHPTDALLGLEKSGLNEATDKALTARTVSPQFNNQRDSSIISIALSRLKRHLLSSSALESKYNP
jgi:hypothetical protein